MSASASTSRQTRASIAAPAFVSASAAASGTRARDTSRRRTTTGLSRHRPDPIATDSSDLDYQDFSDRRLSLSKARAPLDDTDDAISEEDVVQEALDELLVLEQLTPRPNRRIRIETAGIDTTQSALDRFRAQDQRGKRPARASIAGPPPTSRTLSYGSALNRPRASVGTRQRAPLARIADPERDLRTMFPASSDKSAAATMSRGSRRPNASAPHYYDESVAAESIANISVARPGQRLRPSLAHPDGRLDIPTLEERCAALIINAKGVLHFYMSLYDDMWQPESFDEMLRNWTPFESYKTNQLLAEAQYMHHFIDIDEVTRSLRRESGQSPPEGFEEAMKMANCATFVHYIHQLPTDPSQYGRARGQHITGDDVVRAPFRNIRELSDARRVFLRWILPTTSDITDEILNMLLDISIQIYIHRLERIVEAVFAGQMAEDVGRTAISDHLIDLMSGDIVRHSLGRVKRQRRMSRADIERMVQRYETFANVRQIELQNMQFDYDAMRETFSFQNMAADLTGYVRDVVREVDDGMHSTSLPPIIDRLARESSVFSASDVPDIIPPSSSIVGGKYDESSSAIAGPSQSTPKRARSTQASQPYAAHYAGWLDEMLDEDDSQPNTQRRRPAQVLPSGNAVVELTDTQKLRELDVMSSTDGEGAAPSIGVDSDVASSPPRDNRLGARISAAINSSGRPATHSRRQPSDVGEPSESSDANGALEPLRHRDGPFDSPAKEKAGRLGFDSQNRLVRRNSDGSRKNQRLLDGSAAGVRESRFDSQGEEEEDVFLENAARGGKRSRRKGKGKGKAKEPVALADAETEGQGTPRPRRNLRSNAGRQPTGTIEDLAVESEQVASKTGSRGMSRQLQLKQESLSPAKRRTEQRAEEGAKEQQRSRRVTLADPPAEVQAGPSRVTRSRAARANNGDGRATGLGRGLPDGEDARSQARILSTTSGRLHEEGDSSDEDQDEGGNETVRNRIEGVQSELGATRATPDEDFIGDDDEAILRRRAAMDAAIAARKPRPGTLHFYRPEADDDAMPLVGLDDEPLADGENVDAIAMRDADAVAEILRSSNTVPSRRIGPYRPENGRRRRPREEADPALVDRYSQEIDELEDDQAAEPGSRRHGRRANTHTAPLGQAVRVEPYKRSNLYITGHNMTGRSRWTDAETECLLTSLHELARYKKVSPKFTVYTEILKRHGVNGTRSKVLARWNNVQLKDKSRNELMRMKREGMRIPYWKRLLHANIWKPKPVVVERGRRDETEDVPDVGSDAEVPGESEAGDVGDPIVEDRDDADADGVEVVIGELESVEDGVQRSSNPLRNED
ncbi:MYB DNA binding protein [Pseudozyma hubeiensis SY62]|uniref:MYB DNA binding protein n=1 Tax=Pseudozyma hubeiensis (strain SY62) TaxID=1305764 RepID=R9PBF1_PSEHS|nr:MYB DNA binding protein [Pseudozyma hubeiensis SY62]GAC98567.1 MYB DNA binding protein [Pseudozyma hubeiensis SY62]